MNKKLVKSIASLVTVLALGVGATFALFTSNTVTVSNNTLTTGEATIKLCNADGDDNWKNSVSPGLVLNDMVPSAAERELTQGSRIYLGNDSGALTDNVGGGTDCNVYGDPAGSSDVSMRMRPLVTLTSCPDPLDDQLSLRFDIGGSNTGYASLFWWTTNANTYAPTFNVDETAQVRMYSQLDSSATAQNTTCTFDVTFTGEQQP